MRKKCITLAWRGQDYDLETQASASIEALVQQLQQQHVQQPLALHTLVLKPPGSQPPIRVQAHLGCSLDAAGVQPGQRVLLLGSFVSEVQALAAAELAHASLRLPSFEHEAQRAAQRAAVGAGDGPGKQHHFGAFRALPANPLAPAGAPAPSVALELLHKLATDPAVEAVMRRHGWSVALLSEMPPEGLVGVSAVCILGYNRNRGQEISLRLRTDDWEGLRKYASIRRTLVHELAHNVHDEHDNDFKALNSQLLREVEAHEAAAAAAGARTLAGLGAAFQPAAVAPSQQQQRPRMLADGDAQQLPSHVRSNAREAALAAALARQRQQPQQQPGVSQLPSWQATAASGSVEGSSSNNGTAPAAAGAAGAVEEDASAMLQQYEHDDPLTAAAEEAVMMMEGLSCSCREADGGHVQQQQQSQEQHQHQHQQQQPQQQPQQQGHLQQSHSEAAEDAVTPPNTPALGNAAQLSRPPATAAAAAAQAAAAAAGDDDMQLQSAAGLDDVVSQKLRAAQALLQQVQVQAGGVSDTTALRACLEVLVSVLGNVAAHPREPRFQRVRLAKLVRSQAGRAAAAQQLLVLAGYEHRLDSEEEVLLYVRHDPGLLWLVLSLVRAQLEEVLQG